MIAIKNIGDRLVKKYFSDKKFGSNNKIFCDEFVTKICREYIWNDEINYAISNKIYKYNDGSVLH